MMPRQNADLGTPLRYIDPKANSRLVLGLRSYGHGGARLGALLLPDEHAAMVGKLTFLIDVSSARGYWPTGKNYADAVCDGKALCVVPAELTLKLAPGAYPYAPPANHKDYPKLFKQAPRRLCHMPSARFTHEHVRARAPSPTHARAFYLSSTPQEHLRLGLRDYQMRWALRGLPGKAAPYMCMLYACTCLRAFSHTEMTVCAL